MFKKSNLIIIALVSLVLVVCILITYTSKIKVHDNYPQQLSEEAKLLKIVNKHKKQVTFLVYLHSELDVAPISFWTSEKDRKITLSRLKDDIKELDDRIGCLDNTISDIRAGYYKFN